MMDSVEYTPRELAKAGPHTLAAWREAYAWAVRNNRQDWPQIAQAIVDLRLHPSVVSWLDLATDAGLGDVVKAESQLRFIAEKTYTGRWMQVGTELRAFSRVFMTIWPLRYLRPSDN